MFLYQARRVLLIALMLIGFVVLFAGLSTPALADTPPGEFCGGNTGFPCPTPAQATPAQSISEPPITSTSQEEEYKKGYDAGKEAGKNSDGTYQECPLGNTVEYCQGWDRGYKEGLRQRPPQQGQGGRSLNDIVNDIPPILKFFGIIAGVLLIVWMGASLAGLSLAGAAATGIRAGMVLARAAARFLKKL